MKIKYNAPTTLTYAFFCTLVVALDHSLLPGLTRAFFTVPDALAFDPFKPLNYFRLVSHIAGHVDWNHLISNLAYVLLLGPLLEEAYGSLTMLLMILVTGFVTGVLNVCFFPHPLLGASGVVFMMILLASFTNHGKDDVPLTFILIVILYLGREVMSAFNGDDISRFAHLAGGLCGSLFGFFKPAKSGTGRKTVSAVTTSASGRISRPEATRPGTRTHTGTPAVRQAVKTSTNPAVSRSGTAPSRTGKTTITLKKTPSRSPRQN